MPQPVESLLEQLHTAFPELEESVELDEGIASTIGRGIGNIGRGVAAIGRGIGRGIGNTATNFAAGVTGISDEMINSLIQTFENPAAPAAKGEAAPTPAEEPQEGAPLDTNNLQDVENYYNDLVQKIFNKIKDGTAPAGTSGVIGQIWKSEGANLSYSNWKIESLEKLNAIGTKVFPDWQPRSFPTTVDKSDSPAQEKAEGAA